MGTGDTAVLQAFGELGFAVAVWDRTDSLEISNERYRAAFGSQVGLVVAGVAWQALVETAYRQVMGSDGAHLIENEQDIRSTGGRITSVGPDGRWYDKSVQRLQAGGRLEIWHDVTELRQRIIEQKAMEERYTIAMQAANEGLVEWNLVSRDIYLAQGTGDYHG